MSCRQMNGPQTTGREFSLGSGNSAQDWHQGIQLGIKSREFSLESGNSVWGGDQGIQLGIREFSLGWRSGNSTRDQAQREFSSVSGNSAQDQGIQLRIRPRELNSGSGLELQCGRSSAVGRNPVRFLIAGTTVFGFIEIQ